MTSEPVLSRAPSPDPGSEETSHTPHFLFRWLVVPARPDPRAGREPFDRLRFWTLGHPLNRRLDPYEVTETGGMFRPMTWDTLRFWSLLLNEDDEGIAGMLGVDLDLPDPDQWFGRTQDAKTERPSGVNAKVRG